MVASLDHYPQAFIALLEKKQLLDGFKQGDPAQIQLQNDIAEHARWIFEFILKVAYVNNRQPGLAAESGIERFFHGIQHAGRVAVYATVFANLFRKLGDEEALALSEADLKLIQIAALFHDSAREDDKADHWDHESALLLYYYLTVILQVDTQKAIHLAEAVANKDTYQKKFLFKMSVNAQGEVHWKFDSARILNNPQKNIAQKIIHDGDCLEITRISKRFNRTYLDAYKATPTNNLIGLQEITQLEMEAKNLLAKQGDACHATDAVIKKKYETGDAFLMLLSDIAEDKNSMIYKLGRGLLSQTELNAMQLVEPSFANTSGMFAAGSRKNKINAATPDDVASKIPRTGVSGQSS